MNNEIRSNKPPYTAVYLAAAFCLFVYLLALGIRYSSGMTETVHDFSEGWLAETGKYVSLDQIKVANFGGSVRLLKSLPAEISEEDEFCFQTQNANVTVRINGREVYRFIGRENLTGQGYGVAFHIVGISPADARKTVEVQLDSALANHAGGRMWRTYVCPGADYVRLLIRERILPCVLSGLVIFFGVLLFLIYFSVPDKGAMPYNVAALGTAALFLGIWGLNDTNIPQLLTGHIYVCRTIDRMLLFFVMYPLACFTNSLTHLKRPVYPRIALWMSAFFLALLLGLRYGFGIDMIFLNSINYAYFAATLLLPALILADNARYCKAHGLRTGLSRINVGLGTFAACCAADVFIYVSNLVVSSMHGIFTRFGLAFFIAMMLLQFLRWWSHEHATIARSRFVNRALQYAVSANEPEVSIRALLEYLGTELRAKRTYIFEEQNNGTWHGTYEWYAEGMSPRRPDLLDLPYTGLIDVLYKVFKRSNRLIVDNVEAYRVLNPILYRILRENNVERMVVGPLEANGKLIGLFGVDDAPQENLAEISEIIRLISYFFAQLVIQRESQERLIRYSYFDSLTGARNRRACNEFESEKLDAHGSYGYLMCDINGLKAVNDQLGHEAGDALIIDVAKSLIEVFGAENVYRMGGDEFAVYGFEPEESAFDADVARAKVLIAEKGRSASIGMVYCAAGTMDKAQVKAEADARMYQEKKRYYEGAGNRRHR